MRELARQLRARLRQGWIQRRGAAKGLQELRTIAQIARLSLLIVPLVLAPVLVLTGLALRSLRSEEVLIDATLRQRSEALAAQVVAGQRALFVAFEEDVLARLDASDDTMTTLSSPGLVGAFRFDADGRLAWPFVLPDDRQSPAPTLAWRRGAVEARALEASNRDVEARASWLTLAARPADPVALRVEARLGAARALARTAPELASTELVLVAADAGDARDEDGRRIADLAHLLQADLADTLGRRSEADVLRRAVAERALASAWTVGRPADGLLARLALEKLEGRMDPSARRLALRAVLDRLADLRRAADLVDELRLVASRGSPEAGFAYLPQARTLWVTHGGTRGLWAFAFDLQAFSRELDARVVRVASSVDADLRVSLAAPGDAVPDTLTRRSLAPDLPRLDVVVSVADPAELASRRRVTRDLQRLAVLLAVLSTGLGMFLTARTIQRELETARQKADFAANVSHELRSPITQIRLKAESLLLDLVEDEAERQEHHAAIVRESERLSRLVDNVLDFSAIERGVKRYHLRPDDVGDVVVKAVEATRAAAEDAGFELDLELPEDVPVVWLDRDALGQVVTNLLSNALKYGGDGGTIEVRVRNEARGVRIDVTDHGIGIATEDQAAIFEHFYRVSSSDVRRKRGTGIGLTIVRYIVEAHGGTIAVTSEIGRGSTFTVRLPLEPPPDAGA